MTNLREKEFKILKQFAKKYAPTATFKIAEECYYDNELDELGFCFDQVDEMFDRHIRTEHKFPDIDKINLNLFSLLHEIGHYHTMDECDESEEDELTRTLFSVIPYEVAYCDYEITRAYFNLDMEWQATEWAINFCKKHWILVQNLSRKLDKAKEKYFKKKK